jgi:NADPH-dependent glutamate synthase beta subunit-like oxidoreductase|tara:strand:+ start:1116 stop:2855 length:1740 start_codon:yes stop_codon:yes gene_type:complete
MTLDSNPILDFANEYEFPEYSDHEGINKVVAFGDESHKCPIYIKKVPPCTAGCPAGEDIRGFHNLLTGDEKSDNKWDAAWYRIVDTNPFPAIMGRICPHPCESTCNRQHREESIGINAVEQAIGEHGIEAGLKLPQAGPDTGMRVAVIGAGPAGLSVAYQLRRKGHAVTIYDFNEKPGGMMLYGIMGYRVDRKVLDAEVGKIIDLGIETKMGIRVGTDISLEQLEKDYDAVFIGVGAQIGRSLPIEGFSKRPETTNAIDFLRNYELQGDDFKIGKKVVVIGDGNVAMDVARLARRMGSESTIISAVPREEMNCYPDEFDDAIEEGAKIEYLVGTFEVLESKNGVQGVKCAKMVKKEKGEEGWDAKIPFMRYKATGDVFEIESDMIVASIGQTTDMNGFENTINENDSLLKLDKYFRVKGKENVFGGGDALKIDLITTAVGHGRKAADSIDAFLQGKNMPEAPYREVINVKKQDLNYFFHSNQTRRRHQVAENIVGNHNEVLEALTKEQAIEESKRCMSCGLCFDCKQCSSFCPQEAISRYKDNPIGEVMYTHYTKCVGCHLCALVCPTGYIQMGMGEGL